MTEPISPRDQARRQLPGALRRALAKHGIRQCDLAATLGVRETTISEWCRGIRFPSMAQARGLGDLEPRLPALLIAAHTVECEVCGKSTVHGKRNPRPRFCSDRCKATFHSRKRREARVGLSALTAHRLELHHVAVAAFCRQCEPEGMCRDAACPLRPVSPLPLADGRLRVA